MATYYVRKTGSDAANGTSPATAWATIAFALGNTSGFAAGDTLYIGAGIYREVVSLGWTNNGALTTTIFGDVYGTYTGDAGEVQLTAYTTNDTTAPSSANLVAYGARDNIKWYNTMFVGGANGTELNLGEALDCGFYNCAFEQNAMGGGNSLISVTCPADTALNFEAYNCLFFHNQRAIIVTALNSAIGNYDMNINVWNCAFYCAGRESGIRVQASGANTAGSGGGVEVRYCTYFGSGGLLNIASAILPNTNVASHNIIFNNGGSGLAVVTNGQIVSSHNYFYTPTAGTHVSDATDFGPNSVTVRRGIHFGQDSIWSGKVRPFATPVENSPFLAKGNMPGTILNNADAHNHERFGSWAAGAFERHDVAKRETTVVQGGSVSIVITGPGDHDFLIRVFPQATSISLWARYDSNHGATNKPQAALFTNGKIGLGISANAAEAQRGYAEVETMTAAADLWQKLTFSTFTPTQEGVVRIRVISRSDTTGGKAYFDTPTS